MWKHLICILNSGCHQVKPTTKPVGIERSSPDGHSVRRQETCFAKVVRNAPGSKDGLLGKFPERTQTVICRLNNQETSSSPIYTIWTHAKNGESILSALCIIILFYMSYLQMVNRTCSKPKCLKELAFRQHLPSGKGDVRCKRIATTQVTTSKTWTLRHEIEDMNSLKYFKN